MIMNRCVLTRDAVHSITNVIPVEGKTRQINEAAKSFIQSPRKAIFIHITLRFKEIEVH